MPLRRTARAARRALERLPQRLAERLEWSPPPAVQYGNRLELLINGEQYFPRLLAAIEAATRSVHIETYIFADDRIGTRVADALSAAAARGVAVHLLVDGFGGGSHARKLLASLAATGVLVRIFRPERWWRLDRKLLRRLHRKLAVIDDVLAFVGGINIIDDYTDVPRRADGSMAPRFDFAVQCRGPIVAGIALAARRLWWTLEFIDLRRLGSRGGEPLGPLPRPAWVTREPAFADGVPAVLLLRDTLRNRRTIERAYLEAIAGARREVLIACAYFIPGRRFRQALLAATRRGVRVRLLLQGRVEYAIQHYGQQALYGQLLDAGIEIHEYAASYLHAKVAVVDAEWATVGSSNIDPYSLLLAREANVAVFDARFARALQASLEQALARDAEPVEPAHFARRGRLTRALNWIAYGLLRFAIVVLARGKAY